MSALRIVGVGAMTSLGVGAVQLDAALRAGISRFHEGPWKPGGFRPVLARANDEVVAAFLGPPQLGGWAQRTIALAAIALADAMATPAGARKPEPVVLLLGLPDPRDVVAPSAASLWPALTAASGVAIDGARSQIFASGRAAIFDALAAAAVLLDRSPEATVVCGAVDSYADEARVVAEDRAGRTAGGPYAGDGRVLGEAAGMLVVEPLARHRGGLVIESLARRFDPGCRHGTAPARGEGLAEVIEALRAQGEQRMPYATVWAGLLGENHDARMWGTACLRHGDLLPAGIRVEHPADRLGDAGAGLGALMFVDAHQSLVAGRRSGPALVWAISDHGPCGCATVSVETPGS